MISGHFRKNEKLFEVICSYGVGQKKSISENGKEYGKFSDHIGKYPLVMVAPNDIELIWDGGEVRRKFFDSLLSQVDREYLEHLIVYQAHLRQRNSLLRMSADQGGIDRDLLDSYDEKIVDSGVVLFQKRSAFIADYMPLVAERYNFLAADLPETSAIQYVSELEKVDFRKELQVRISQDLALGRTTVGIHRDDYLFTLNGFELKRYGSQGQQKSFLIALKLAEFDYLARHKNTKPMILLDDIFDKLDDVRTVQLMKLVQDGTFGQIFITDASPSRSLDVLEKAGIKSQNFMVEGGNLSNLLPV
jgi:DNA replication and repair protein RecF